MPDLQDGESIEVQGSAAKPYVLKNIGGVYSCSCPAWRNQSLPIERRTCKHLRALRGAEAEQARVGGELPSKPQQPVIEKQAPPLLLSETWDGERDLSGWWLSEKLDGVRALWTGTEFRSRQGNRYHAPRWFTVGLPNVPLDGELWIGRKLFQRTVSIVRRQDESQLWQEVRFLIFDAPDVDDGFEGRMKLLCDCLAKHQPAFAQAHQQVICPSLAHLRQELARITALGGEGLMLRQPGSRYAVGRSPTLLKVKTFQDAEAQVIGHQPGTGRHRGRLGALLVELPNGVQFAVGTGLTDAERERPPAIGSTVSFRYQELSDAGVPRFPVYAGIRREIEVSPRKGAMLMATPMASPFHRFEYIGGTSCKFWEVAVSGSEVVVRYGRIGTSGQTQTKSFLDADVANRHAEKLIREKLAKGYQAAA